MSVFSLTNESRRVYTCDSLPHSSNYQTGRIILMRKWIAKSMSLINDYIKNNETESDLSFGSGEMADGIEFNDEVEKKLKNNGKIYFMYDHGDISEMKGIPLQQDSFNCGRYTIWYLLMVCY